MLGGLARLPEAHVEVIKREQGGWARGRQGGQDGDEDEEEDGEEGAGARQPPEHSRRPGRERALGGPGTGVGALSFSGKLPVLVPGSEGGARAGTGTRRRSVPSREPGSRGRDVALPCSLWRLQRESRDGPGGSLCPEALVLGRAPLSLSHQLGQVGAPGCP